MASARWFCCSVTSASLISLLCCLASITVKAVNGSGDQVYNSMNSTPVKIPSNEVQNVSSASSNFATTPDTRTAEINPGDSSMPVMVVTPDQEGDFLQNQGSATETTTRSGNLTTPRPDRDGGMYFTTPLPFPRVPVHIQEAVYKGVDRQLELCGMFCTGDFSYPTYTNPNSSCSSPLCASCHCDSACELYGDCCPLLGDDRLPDVGAKPLLCLQVNVGCSRQLVQVIAGCPASSPSSSSAQGRSQWQQAERCAQCAVSASSRRLVLSLDSMAVYCNQDCAACNGEVRLTTLADTPCAGHGLDVLNWGPHSDAYPPPWLVPTVMTGRVPDVVETTSSLPAVVPNLTTSDTLLTHGGQDVPLCPQIHLRHAQFLNRSCSSIVEVAGSHVSTCHPGLITNQQSFGRTMKDLCARYSYPVISGGTRYRNLFCALCHGQPLNDGPCSTEDMRTVYLYNVEFHISDYPSGGITLLTRLQPWEYIHAPAEPGQCQTGQWYDPVVETCRSLTCLQSRSLSASETACIHSENNSSTAALYCFNVLFTPLQTSGNIRCFRNLLFIQRILLLFFAETIKDQLGCTSYSVSVNDFMDGEDWGSFSVALQLLVDTNKDDYNQTAFEFRIKNLFTRDSLPLKNLFDDSVVVFETSIASFDTVPGVGISFLSLENGSCCYVVRDSFDMSSYFSYIAAKLYSSSWMHTVDFSPMLSYALVLLNTSEVVYMAETDLYNLTFANASLDAGQVEDAQDGFFVPVKVLRETYEAAGLMQEPIRKPRHPTSSLSDNILQVLSTSCLVVSVVSLTFLLATYASFPNLRTVPGVNNIFLATWLWLAQVLLLTVPGRTSVVPLCRALGLVLHYSWLCVLSWSSVCSFHMFHVFVTQQDRPMAPHRRGWYVKRYAAFAQATPAAVVVAVVVSRLALTSGQDMGYGGMTCYLNSVLLVGLAFVMPLALSVLFNLVQLALTARALCQTERVTHHRASSASDRGESSNVGIYARLSSLTGLFWVVALLSEVPGCWWLSYVSAVLNGLQGLHLAVSYTGNRRVLKLWREKTEGLRRGKGQPLKDRPSSTSTSSRFQSSQNTTSSTV